MSAKVRKVAVIGAGIVGSSSALLAVEKIPNIEVTLISEKFSPYTTGDGSAAILRPYLLSLNDIEPEKLRFWIKKSFDFFQNIFKSADAGKCGVAMLPIYELSTTLIESPLFTDVYLDWRPMNSKELALFPSQYKYGNFLTTFIVECSKLIPVLLKKFQERGGKIIKQKVKNFSELFGKYDVIINCTGLGASDLTNDPSLTPVRGQIIRVKAPWLKFGVIAGESHILPSSEETICGGTLQIGDWNLDVDPKDREKILSKCLELHPSIKDAEIIREFVGLRPGRPVPRVERETLHTEKGTIEVIHNYGHGASGVTIGWGTAHEAVTLLEDSLSNLNLKDI